MPSYTLQELYHDLAEGVPSVNTDDATIGSAAGTGGSADERPAISNEAKTFNVPADSSEIQPLIDEHYATQQRHNLVIKVDPDNYTAAEDLTIPAALHSDLQESGRPNTARLRIENANDINGTNRFSLGGLMSQGQIGNLSLDILGAEFTNAHPDARTDTVVSLSGTRRARFWNCAMATGATSLTDAFELNQSTLELDHSFDFESGVFDNAFQFKGVSYLTTSISGADWSGSVTNLVDGEAGEARFHNVPTGLSAGLGPLRGTTLKMNGVQVTENGEWNIHSPEMWNFLSDEFANSDVVRLHGVFTYNLDSIDTDLTIIGAGQQFNAPTLADNGSGDITLNGVVMVRDCRINSAVDVQNQRCRIEDCSLVANITANADSVFVRGCNMAGNDITYAAGTADGFAGDNIRTGTVADNSGSNTIGTNG